MNNILIVFKKELTDIFRDKKTLMISILIPLLLFPVMFGFIGNSASNIKKDLENNFKIAVKDEGKSSFTKFIKTEKNVKLVEVTNTEEAVKKGDIFLALEIPKEFDEKIGKESQVGVKIIYDNSSQQSQMALGKVNSLVETYSKSIVAQRLTERGINASILTPIKSETITVEKTEQGSSKMILSLLLPMFLLIYCVTGPMPSATDLGAGEKERGTLEPLLTTPVNRLSLLWGKLFAITVMGFLTSLSSILGIVISMVTTPSMFGGEQGQATSLTIEPITLVFIGIIALLTTMVFGALELSISIYARSFKEAQTYLAPLNIIAIIPVYATYMMDAKNISSIYFHIPIANISCLLKELISGIYNTNHILIVFAWIFVYVLGSILFARYMFSREEVIFRT